MEPIENIKYGHVLITSDSISSLALLKSKIELIRRGLHEKGVAANDKVIVLLKDTTKLLPALWALLKSNITCVPVDETDVDVFDIARRSGATCIVTEKIYAAKVIGFNTLIIDQDEAALAFLEIPEAIGEVEIPYLFYEKEDNYKSAIIFNNKSVADFYETLDKTISPEGKDILMLSTCLPYYMLVLEMIWASSRGIPIVIYFPDQQISLSRYTAFEEIFAMDFGLFYFGSHITASEKDKYKLLFETVQFADKNSFSSVWTPERHFNEFGGLFPNPSVLSAALAVSTSEVQIRSGSLVSPLHHPVRIAEDWALVDNLSNGRVAISFASGWQCDDFIFFPENYSNRHDFMMKQIKTVKQLWEGESVVFKNGLDKDTPVVIYPKPVQKELPVWITVSGKTETFIDAGKVGANILTHLLWQDTDELIEKIAAYRSSLRANGFDPYSRKVSVMVHTYLGSDNDTIKNKVRDPLKNYIRTSTQLIQSMAKSTATSTNAKDVGGRYGGMEDEIEPRLMDELAEIAFNRFFDQAGLLGTIEKSKEMIKRLKGYDVDEIAALIDFGLNGEDIMHGLDYLNALRKMYDKNTLRHFPVTISHCSLASLDKLQSDPAGAAFFAGQRLMLATAENVEAVPLELAGKIRTIQRIHEPGKQVVMRINNKNSNIDSLFNASVSNEF